MMVLLKKNIKKDEKSKKDRMFSNAIETFWENCDKAVEMKKSFHFKKHYEEQTKVGKKDFYLNYFDTHLKKEQNLRENYLSQQKKEVSCIYPKKLSKGFLTKFFS